MNIFHIARIKDDPCSGVSVAVPKHVLSQQNYANVGFLNIENVRIPGIKLQFEYDKNFSVSTLLEQFGNLDIVVFHEVYYPSFLKIARELKKYKIPYIIVPHGCLTRDAQHKKYLKKKIGNVVFFNRFIENAVAIQYLSEIEKNTSGYGDVSFIGTNGIELPVYTKGNFNSDRIEFLFIGRMDPYHKGLDLLIQAIVLISSLLRQKKAMFRLYGPSTESQYVFLSRMIEENSLEDIVVLEKEIIGDKKREALLNADLFIQTSRFEGMPMGVLEALGSGLPCLLSEGTCIGNSVAEANAGWVCATTPEAIADMISFVCNNKELWSTYSKNAVSFIKREFALDVVARKTVQVYEKYASLRDT